MLKDLSNPEISIHLVLSNSGKASVFIHDALKNTYKATLDSMYEIKTAKEFSLVSEMSAIQPYLADKWIFEINFPKVKNTLGKQLGVLESTTSCFCFFVNNYREFREAKELLSKNGMKVNDLYIPIIRKSDVYYLLKDYELSEKVIDFIATSYARDPENIFELREYLAGGYEVNTQRDVVKLVGASSGSINSFIMLLFSKPPETERGLKMVFKRRIQMGVDLCNAYGVSTFRNFLNASVYDILQIKILYLQGKIYDRVGRDLPNGFDEARLGKYSFYLSRIKNEISYDSITRLYCMLQEPQNVKWVSVQNMIEFIYQYYGGVADGIVG